MENSNQRSKIYLFSVLLITIVGAMLRLRNLDNQSMWADELFTVQMAMSGTWEEAMGASIVTGDLYGWFVYQYAQIFGDSDLVLRASSVVPGILLIPLVAEIGRNYYNEGTGVLASAFLSISFHGVRYSQEFRAYMLVTFLIWFAAYLMSKKSIEINLKLRWMIICLLCSSFVIHYFAAMAVVLLITAYSLTTMNRWVRKNNQEKKLTTKNLGDYLNSQEGSVIAIAFAVLFLGLSNIRSTVTHGTSNHSMWIPETPSDVHLVLLGHFFSNPWSNSNWETHAMILFGVVSISPLILYLSRSINNTFRNGTLLSEEPEFILWSQTVIPLLMVIIYSYFVRPLFVIRYMTFFLPAWILLISVSISRINDLIFSGRQEIIEGKLDSVPVFFMAVVIVTSGIPNANSLIDHEYKTDYESASYWLDENAEEDSYIVSHSFPSYWNSYLERIDSEVRVADGSQSIPIPDRILNHIEANEPKIVIYVQSHTNTRLPDSGLESLLEGSYVLNDDVSFYDTRIREYWIRSVADG